MLDVRQTEAGVAEAAAVVAIEPNASADAVAYSINDQDLTDLKRRINEKKRQIVNQRGKSPLLHFFRDGEQWYGHGRGEDLLNNVSWNMRKHANLFNANFITF